MSLPSKTWRASSGLLFSWLLSWALFWVAPVRADDGRVQLACPVLTREQAAEVEARVRVALLAAAAPVTRVAISCEPERARITVSSEETSVERAVALGLDDLKERLLAEVDAALLELAQSPASGRAPLLPIQSPPVAPAEPPQLSRAPAPRPPPLAAARSEWSQADKAPAPADQPPLKRAELFAQGGAEAWRDATAVGAAVGLAYGSRALSFGVCLRGNTQLATGGDFAVQEWGAAASVAWTPHWAWGLRAQIELGPSLLNVTPQGQLAPRGSTAVSAWYGALTISRPLWLGHAAVVPGVGARAFTEIRRVNVDGREEVALGRLVPGLSLGLLYVLN